MPLLMCPNCTQEMKHVTRHAVELDMCPECRGVWLDRGELEKIMGAVRAAEQDGAEAERRLQQMEERLGGAPQPPPQPQPPRTPPAGPPPWGGPPPHPASSYPPTYGQSGPYGPDPRYEEYGRHRRRKRHELFDIFDIFDD